MPGRNSIYTEELGNKICESICQSTIGLKHICKELDIAYSTVTGWIYDKTHPFSEKYTRAKEIQLEVMAEETLDIADDGSNDLMLMTKANGEQYEMENKEVTNRSKLRVETRKWLLSKLAPKKYGDKIEHSGELNVAVTGMKIV